MNIVITVLVLLVFTGGVLFRQKGLGEKIGLLPKEKKTNVLSTESQNSVIPTSRTNEDSFNDNVQINTTPKITSFAALIDISKFVYPGSSVISQDTSNIKLESSDSWKEVTDWYKEKIKMEGLNINSYVTTTTNDNVLSKLVGADSKREIRVEINKNAGETKVHVSVSL